MGQWPFFCVKGFRQKVYIMNKNSAKELLRFQTFKEITYLYKRYLMVVEDLREEYKGMIQKLEENVSEEDQALVRVANFLDENRFALIRKRILDSGNEAIRSMEQHIEKFKVEFEG